MFDYPCVILCGGKSSRMKTDKSLLPYDDYSSLAQFQLRKFEQIFSSVYISAKENKFDFKANLILDEFEEFSPMIAIYSILSKFDGFVFIVSVDSPNIDFETIKKLESFTNEYDVVLPKDEQKIHPLCGFYHSSLAQKAKSLIEQDIHKMRMLFDEAKHKEILFEDKSLFLNLNFFEEYEEANYYKKQEFFSKIPDLKKLKEKIKSSKYPIIFLIEINNFNKLDAQLGSEILNFLLIELSKILKSYSACNSLEFFKVAYSEFAFFRDSYLDLVKLEADVLKLSKFLENIEIYYPKQNHKIKISFHFGISIDKTSCIKKAYKALEIARDKDKPFAFYSKTLENEFGDIAIEWAEIFEKAIQENKLEPFFQAIVDESLNIEYYEALARITLKDGTKEPKHFFAALKLYSLTNILTTTITTKINDLASAIPIAINLNQEGLKNFKNYPVFYENKGLKFEISSYEIEKNPDLANDFIESINATKEQIIIDHFNNEKIFSSKLDFSKIGYIKLHKNLTKNLNQDKNAEEQIKNLVKKAKKYNVKTIAINVNSKEIFTKLKKLNIDFYQGYFFQIPQITPSSIIRKN